MTITLSQTDFWDLFASESKTEASNQLETVYQYPQQLGKGYLRDHGTRYGGMADDCR
ncbi:MAG: hypothetical protein N4J56_006837 [Chroococcidiopsis sp. SAG 2025]|nr:hypothetical protein [Chroococcidiopsis sp. SAG 2025]